MCAHVFVFACVCWECAFRGRFDIMCLLWVLPILHSEVMSLTWTQNLPIWLVFLGSLPLGSPASTSQVVNLYVSHPAHPEFRQMLRIRTVVFMLASNHWSISPRPRHIYHKHVCMHALDARENVWWSTAKIGSLLPPRRSGDQTQTVKLGGRHPYAPSHLACPQIIISSHTSISHPSFICICIFLKLILKDGKRISFYKQNHSEKLMYQN